MIRSILTFVWLPPAIRIFQDFHRDEPFTKFSDWIPADLSAGILSKVAIAASDHTTFMFLYSFERKRLCPSVDGGTTWTSVVCGTTIGGVIDIALHHPADPDRIFVAVWNRIRNNHESLVAGLMPVFTGAWMGEIPGQN